MADPTYSFNCMWWDGRKISVELSETWGDWHHTEDPDWIVHWPDGSVERFLWLNYINPNGAKWQGRCHCSTSNNVIYPQVEIKQDGADGTGDRPGILVVDWQRNTWTVDVAVDNKHPNADGKIKPNFVMYNYVRDGH